jgi:TldD protein
MSNTFKTLIFLSFFFYVADAAYSQNKPDELLTIVESELAREKAEFSKTAMPPYYFAYRINDMYRANAEASFGSLTQSATDHSRILVTEMKVGDYKFDNTHPMESYDDMDVNYDMPGGAITELPLENKPEAIQLRLWFMTQKAYRQALESYKSVKNAPKASESKVDDFSKEPVSVHIDEPLKDFASFFSQPDWNERVKRYSEPFLKNEDVVDAKASIEVGMERKYFISSEGTRVTQNRYYAYLTITGSVRADDGDVVPLHQSYFAFDPSQLPSDEVILKDVEQMIQKLAQLRKAPVADPYSGPAILHARAAGVFFHEIFGHRVEGHRFKSPMDGQTFKGKIQQEVLLKSLSVTFDPTLNNFKGQDLNGYYRFDDQGVQAKKVKVVENGVLKTFLMSRTPIENLASSNGHGRGDVGADPVSRQSNLIIENKKVVPMNDLRKMLISECKKQKKTYGYFFKDVIGGFTMTDRFMPNAFNIFPTEVYRVYVDGRPDELVRGVDLIGTPLTMFSQIDAADDSHEVFTGFCGAESGSIPVTAISPSLFVKRIETQKKPLVQVDKPLLKRPEQKPAQ